MIDDQVAEPQQFAAIRIANLHDHCCRVVAASPIRADSYRPVAHQIFFFVLVWLVKQKVQFQHANDEVRDRDGVALDPDEIDEQVHRVAVHLAEWGEVVAGLKRQEVQEWELLRIQMERALGRFGGRESDRDDALQNALLKIWSGLGRLIDANTLETTEDIVALVMEHRDKLASGYDFNCPFYAYARRIAQNELISQMRRDIRSPIVATSVEELAEVLEDPSQELRDEEEQAAFELARRHFKINLQSLLNMVQACPTGQRQVLLATLAARPQFWRALDISELPEPDGITRPGRLLTDAELALQLGMSENNIRVQRSHAKRRINSQDSVLGALLEQLIAADGTQD